MPYEHELSTAECMKVLDSLAPFAAKKPERVGPPESELPIRFSYRCKGLEIGKNSKATLTKAPAKTAQTGAAILERPGHRRRHALNMMSS